MRRTSSSDTSTIDTRPGGGRDAGDGSTATQARSGRRDRMELRTRRDGDGALVVSGDLDAGSANAFERILDPIVDGPPDARGERAGGSTIVIDVRGVEFMDSSGLRTLVAASLRAGRRGGRIVLRDVGPRLWRLLEITGLNDHFGIQRADSRTGEGTNEAVGRPTTDRSFHR